MRFATESVELEKYFVDAERRRAGGFQRTTYREFAKRVPLRWTGPWRLVQQTKRSALWRRPAVLSVNGHEVEHMAMGQSVERYAEPDPECRRYHQ